MVTRRSTAAIAAAAAAVLLVSGCVPKTGAPDPNATPTGYSVPAGAAAAPPGHGEEPDPNDNDFFKAAKPPEGAPEGTVTWEVRAQMYNAQGESIGGLATAFINATSTNPRAVGGVAGAHPGPFPYSREAVRLPFQFPIFVQSGIVVSVGATFHAFGDKGDILACWVMGSSGLELRGTRNDMQALGNNSLLTANCYGNIG